MSKTSEKATTRGDRARGSWERRAQGIVSALLLVVPFAIIATTDNLVATPRFIDDNQIFTLQGQIHDHGFAWTVRDHFEERVFKMKRLVPVYLTHKLFEVRVLGTHLTAWSVYTAFVGGLTACALFAFGRLMGFSLFEAICFSLIVVLGRQSVLWWRFLHGEGIGLLLTSLALICIPLGLRDHRRKQLFRVLFVVFAVLASLSKESFVLLLPALALAYLLEYRRAGQCGWLECARRNAMLVGILAAVCLTELIVIKFVLARTYFYYAGWTGFSMRRLVATTFEFFSVQRAWIVVLVLGAAGFVYFLRRQKGTTKGLDQTAIGALSLAALAAGIVLPQFLLYMSSGFSGPESINFSRYLVPSTLVLGLLTIVPLHWMRQAASASQVRRPELVRAARWACIAGLVVYLVLRFDTAVNAAEEFSRGTRDVGNYLDAISYETTPEDTVVVACGKYNLHDNVRRVTVLLTEYLGLKHLYYLPVTGADPLSSFAWDFSETNVYTRQIEASTIEYAAELKPKAVLIPFDDYIPLELPFLLQEADWFHPSEYMRYANEHGDVVYFRTGGLPPRLADYRTLLTKMEASGSIEDGHLRVVGHAQSPEYMERFQLTVDGAPVDSTLKILRTPVAYPDLKQYTLESAEFQLDTDLPDEKQPHDVVLELYLGEKLLARKPVELSEKE